MLAVAAMATGIAGAATAPVRARPATVVFGKSVRLSGQFAHGLSGQTGNVLAKAYPERAFGSNAQVETTRGGRWSLSVAPTIQTTYAAASGSEIAPSMTVRVRPWLTLVRRGDHFFARVVSTASYERRYVLLQRRGRRGWRTLRRVELSRRPSRFDAALPHGRSLVRIFLPRSQAGRGYVASASAPVVVRAG